MADIKKLVFNPDAAEEYFSMLLTSYRDTANDIFRRDNEGRNVSERYYSAEYQKYVGMQIAMVEVLEYFGKCELNDWISAKQPPKEWRKPNGDLVNYLIFSPEFGVDVGNYAKPTKAWLCVGIPCNVTHWKQLPQPPEELQECYAASVMLGRQEETEEGEKTMAIKVIWDDLQRQAEYARASRSRELMYETYGAAKMARKMCAITEEQFMALNKKLVTKGINDPRSYDL